MVQSHLQGAAASTVSPTVGFLAQSGYPASPLADTPSVQANPCQYESVRHMIFGSVRAVHHTIKLLHKLNYAEPNAWSKPIPTGRPNEVMVILTKKVRMM